MTTTTDDTAHTLAALRALAAKPFASFADALRASEAQAQLLSDLLAAHAGQPLFARHVDLIPTILVEQIDELPVAGLSFWGNGRWHIHIRATDASYIQNSAMLHELKHIIDHPVRRQPNALSDADWEALANHFAAQVLAHEPHVLATV